ncbi:MAG: hypothetical protein KJ011_06530 [Burkholderiaceae bacterium]|nr:hypothetical protein [Burkholderiaceae bacterium]
MTFGTNDPIVDDFGTDDAIVDDPALRQRASIHQAVPVDPDRAARARALARRTGIPQSVVERNAEFVAEQERKRELQRQARESRAIGNLLSDPQAARIAHDDVEQLGVIDRLIGSAQRGWQLFRQGHAATATRSNANALANLDDVERRIAAGEAIPEADDWVGAQHMTPEQRAELRAQLRGSLASGASAVVQLEVAKRATVQASPEVRAAQAAKGLGEFWEHFTANPLEFIANVTLESLPASAPGLIGFVGGPAAGMATMGASSYAADYGGSILSALAEEGVNLADQDAVLRAVNDPALMARVGRKAAAHAAAVAAFDAASGGVAGKALSTSKIRNVVSQAFAQGSMGATGEAAGSVAAGGDLHAGEIAAEFFGEFAFAPAEVAAASAGVVVDARRARAAQVQANGAALGEAMAAASQSKLNERDASLLARFADDAAEGETLFVDANTFAQAAQAAGVDLQQVAQRIPTLAEQLAQAEATGADIEIPVGDALAHLQPLAATLVEHARIGDPAAPTIAESYAQADRGAEVAQELAGVAVEDTLSAARTIAAADLQSRIEADIAAAGRFRPEVVTEYASLTAAFYTATAQRLGLTPEAFYAEFGAKVVSDIGANVAAYEAAGRRGAYDPATRTIALLQAADLSTYLHESGHHYLETLVAVADRAPGVAADVDTILQSFGLTREQWAGLDLEARREHHETFARSFEAYLFEGKAPSPALQATFARFRSWLLNVYKSLTSLGVELRPEIREVFDRMVATDAEIAARSLQALDLSGLVDPVELAQYHEAQALAAQDAVTDLQGQTLRDMGRTRRAHGRQMARIRAQLADARALVEAQVSLEVEQEPVFAARAALAAAPANQKLNAGALVDLYGSHDSVYGRFDWSSVRHLATDTGMHPDLVAEQFGFTSGDQLVRALIEAGDPALHVEALTDRRMLEQFGELVDEDGIARAADAAVANEHVERVLLMQANALRRATGSQPILRAQAREHARLGLAGQRLRSVKPGQYRMAVAKSQRLAAEAQARGKIAEAAGHARNALLAHEYHREALRSIKEQTKAKAYLSKFNSPGVRQNLSPDYLQQIDAVLAKLDLRQLTDKDVDRAVGLREWIAQQEEAGLPAGAFDPALVERAMARPLRDLTVEELRGLVDTVRSVEHLARLKQKLLTARDQRTFDAVADELAATIRANSGEAKAIEMDPGRWDRVAGSVRSYFAEHRKFASLVRQMDGGKDAGPLWRALVRPMNDAGNAEALARMRATEQLTGILKPVEAMPGGLGQQVYIPEIHRSLSRQARLAVALNMGNETNRQRLMDGRGWSSAQVGAILKTLTAAEWRTVQRLWTYIESYWPEIAAKETRVAGIAPEKVIASPFTIKSADGIDMQMAGGYYPIAYSPLESDIAQSHDAGAVAKEMLQGAYTRSTTRRGHTKARVEKVVRPVELSLSPLFKHLTQVTHDLSHHEWLIDATRLLRDERVATAIREHYSPEVLKALRATVHDVAVGDIPSAGSTERITARLRRNTTAAVIGWSMTTSLLQPFGLAQSIVRIGPRYVLKGIARWGGDAARMRNSMRWIGEKSSFMKLRNRTLLREMNEVSARIVGYKSKRAQVLDASKFIFMQKMQLIADVPTWIGAYEKALAEGRSEVDAVALADQAVIDSQGSGMTKDQAGVQRGGELAKALTMFYSYFSTTLNLLAESTAQLDGRNALSIAKYMANVALLVVIPAIAPAMLTEALKGGDDWDDPEKMAGKLTEWQVSYLLGLLVWFREIGPLASIFGDGPVFDYHGPAAFRPISDLGGLAKQVKQGDIDGPAIRAVISVMGSWLGIPSTQINRSIRGWESFMEGDAPASSILFGPPPQD